jgi:hypothetical protein
MVIRGKELYRQIAEKTGYYQYEIEDIFLGFLDVMKESIIEGKEIRFDGICTVYAPHNRPRQYWDDKSNSFKMSKGVRKLRVRHARPFMQQVLAKDVDLKYTPKTGAKDEGEEE